MRLPTMVGTHHRLLIVEDDLATLFSLRALFSRRGWEVAVARTVGEALRALDAGPDLILLDLGLPDGDGEVVLHHIREAGLESRVAITSGNLDHDRVRRLRSLRPDLLMSKPIDFDRLYRVCCRSVTAQATAELVAAPLA